VLDSCLSCLLLLPVLQRAVKALPAQLGQFHSADYIEFLAKVRIRCVRECPQPAVLQHLSSALLVTQQRLAVGQQCRAAPQQHPASSALLAAPL
jgi:hypothetical protein